MAASDKKESVFKRAARESLKGVGEISKMAAESRRSADAGKAGLDALSMESSASSFDEAMANEGLSAEQLHSAYVFLRFTGIMLLAVMVYSLNLCARWLFFGAVPTVIGAYSLAFILLSGMVLLSVLFRMHRIRNRTLATPKQFLSSAMKHPRELIPW